MKQTIRILAGLLAMYILSLPVMFFTHAHSHEDALNTSPVEKLAGDFVEADLDCELCNFYFDQQSHLHNEYTQISGSLIFELNTISYPSVKSALFEQQYLRGPPIG